MQEAAIPVQYGSLIGSRLRELRLSHGLSQEAVAAALGTRQTHVSRWELGVNKPELGMLGRLADLYSTTLDYIVLGRGPGIAA